MIDPIDRNTALGITEECAKTLKWILSDEDLSESERKECEWKLDFAESIISDLKNVPSVTPEQRWIPCSGTNGIPDHKVLCCDRYGEELIGWLSYNDDQWLCESEGEMMYDPIAWREKPEPYREEGEQDG